MGGEGELFLIAERLVAEHQHRIAVHPRLDRGDLLRVERPQAIDAGNLAGEARSERLDRYRHFVLLSRWRHWCRASFETALRASSG